MHLMFLQTGKTIVLTPKKGMQDSILQQRWNRVLPWAFFPLYFSMADREKKINLLTHYTPFQLGSALQLLCSNIICPWNHVNFLSLSCKLSTCIQALSNIPKPTQHVFSPKALLTEVVPHIHFSAQSANFNDCLPQEIIRLAFQPLLDTRLDVIIFIPHSHLDPVRGIMALTANKRKCNLKSAQCSQHLFTTCSVLLLTHSSSIREMY